MTLRWSDFKYVLNHPKMIFIGMLLQFSIMPVAAFVISKLFSLPVEMLIGMVLVGTCPGGTASNVICYLARGNVALSVSLTACSTLLAVVATPFITWVLIGQSVNVDTIDMIITIAKIVIIPVALGLLINSVMGERLRPVRNFFPMLSIAAIVFIIAIITALNKNNLSQLGLVLLIAIMLHNFAGLLLGYYAGKIFGYDQQVSRTLAIEVGMQNSGLAVQLASQFFTTAAALPGAIFSIWHNITGSVLAAYWSRKQGTHSEQAGVHYPFVKKDKQQK